MSEIIMAIIVAAFGVICVLLSIIVAKLENRLALTEKTIAVLIKNWEHTTTLAAHAFESQGKANSSMFDLLQMHHVALRLPTGVANEVEKYLKGNEDV